MKEETVKIKMETEGIEEAREEIKALAEAYDSFPPQVQVKGCKDCTIQIYPAQTKIIKLPSEE